MATWESPLISSLESCWCIEREGYNVITCLIAKVYNVILHTINRQKCTIMIYIFYSTRLNVIPNLFFFSAVHRRYFEEHWIPKYLFKISSLFVFHRRKSWGWVKNDNFPTKILKTGRLWLTEKNEMFCFEAWLDETCSESVSWIAPLTITVLKDYTTYCSFTFILLYFASLCCRFIRGS